ncbi:DUF6588 family protein [Aquimarina sp. 2201CG5-10]|uniref:DUF6588 family protein n=1 Tax=Aquimarina callyspongiae TaxID=3098150 RepID=UPI002AB5D1D7|nr:DUF6588 family protein [Aquimarina sp. 2201CG5-10]MDY8138579.1 DUF6588 family protein [Aquimarina sp. 2201CG5-10]
MKKLTLLFVLLTGHVTISQVNIDQILEIGIDNAQRFSQDYFQPAGEGVVNGMSSGWYNSAAAKKLFHFEIGIVGNASFVREEKQSFRLNENDYTDITFRNGPSVQSVANAFGENESDVVLVFAEGTAGEVEITLPDGLGGTGVNFMPTGYLQFGVGLSKGTELKGRFLPKIEAGDNTEIQLYGVGVQHELTSWIFGWKRWPVKISGIIGYTNIKGSYDFTEDSAIDGEGQKVELKANSWLVSGIVSTKLPVLNFYAGLGFYTGSSTTDLLGTYRIENGPLVSQTVTDPLSVEHDESGVKATIGAKLSLTFFRVNLDYTLQNYNNVSLGLNFGW